MDLHEKYYEETQRMPAVLLGVATAAIGFAFHETADLPPTWSLLLDLAAVLCWSGSFIAGVLLSRASALGIKRNIAFNFAVRAGRAEWQRESKAKFDRWNAKAMRRYAWQQWLLLIGALFYLAGHVWRIIERGI